MSTAGVAPVAIRDSSELQAAFALFNQVSHELVLRLGSSRTATGGSSADHFMPQVAQLGVSVPLVTPERVATPVGPPGQMPQGQMPQGRLLLFWGCGEHAPPNQPVVLRNSPRPKRTSPANCAPPVTCSTRFHPVPAE